MLRLTTDDSSGELSSLVLPFLVVVAIAIAFVIFLAIGYAYVRRRAPHSTRAPRDPS